MIEILSEKEYDRLDIFLASKLQITRSFASKIIKNNNVKSNNKIKLKSSSKVFSGQIFSVEIPESENIFEIKPEKIDFKVIYQDEYLIIINKPAGLVVHPAPGNWDGTLVNGLIYFYPELKFLRNRLRPGIVHRLDSSTSGLMVVARTQNVCDKLQKMFQEREIKKIYLALVHGSPEKKEGILSGPIERDPVNFLRMAVIEGGRPALTGYKILWSKKNYSLLKCDLYTGRTHQIRVHLSALGNPIVGDNLYGSNEKNSRVLLHSWRLSFEHPIIKEKLNFCVKIPEDFKNYICDIIS